MQEWQEEYSQLQLPLLLRKLKLEKQCLEDIINYNLKIRIANSNIKNIRKFYKKAMLLVNNKQKYWNN